MRLQLLALEPELLHGAGRPPLAIRNQQGPADDHSDHENKQDGRRDRPIKRNSLHRA